jgi:hypothetical protein
MASILIPWGVAVTLEGIKLIDAAGTAFKVNPTLASGDVKLEKDGGTAANLGTLPAVTPSGGTSVRVVLSATEAEFQRGVVTFVDAAGAEWIDQSILLHTPLAEGALCGKITGGSPSATAFTSSQLTGTNADQYADAWVTFLTGTCAGATKKITAFNAGTDTVTCDALPAAPSVGDVFIIVNGA